MRLSTLFAILCITFPKARCALAKPEKPPPGPTPVFSFPSAVRPGLAVEVKFFEPELGEPLGIWCGFPAESRAVPGNAKPGEARYRISAARDVPVGIYPVRLLTTTGVSHLRLLMVDDLPSTLCTGGNKTVEQALTVSAPIAIDARCDPLTTDYYRVNGKRGERLSAEVVAQRLGSPIDPMIRLLDSSGREMIYCDDAPGIGSDCRFSYVFPADGKYFIEVRDVNYEGGRAYFYRLRLGDFPLITSLSPLGGRRGDAVKFHVDNATPIALDDVAMTLPPGVSRTWLNVKYPQGQGSGFAPVMCSDLDEHIESQPNDTPQTASAIAIPGAISGRFDKPGAPAYFEFHAKQAATISIRGMTRSIGSRAALRLQLLSAEGTRIAESKPEGPEDGSIVATLPAAGVYRIVARELSGSAGPGMFYRLEVREAKPGFSLSVDNDAVGAAAGESVKIKLSAIRNNYPGSIPIHLTGDAEHFLFKPTEIPAGRTSVDVYLQVPDDLKTGTLLNFGIEGKMTIDGDEIIERAGTQNLLKQLLPRTLAPPPELDGLIGLGVNK